MPVSLDQDVSAVVWELAADGRHPLLRFTDVQDAGHEVVTNMFASRRRIERMIGAEEGRLHQRFELLAGDPRPLREVDAGPVLEQVVTGTLHHERCHRRRGPRDRLRQPQLPPGTPGVCHLSGDEPPFAW